MVQGFDGSIWRHCIAGKRNEPSHVVHTAKYLANFYNVDEDEFFALTTNNFFEIFKKAKRPLNEQ